jgi:hypothetical protein
MTVTLKRRLDYEDYAGIPPDRNRYEIIDGDFFVTPAHPLRFTSACRDGSSASWRTTFTLADLARSSTLRSISS